MLPSTKYVRARCRVGRKSWWRLRFWYKIELEETFSEHNFFSMHVRKSLLCFLKASFQPASASIASMKPVLCVGLVCLDQVTLVDTFPLEDTDRRSSDQYKVLTWQSPCKETSQKKSKKLAILLTCVHYWEGKAEASLSPLACGHSCFNCQTWWPFCGESPCLLSLVSQKYFSSGHCHSQDIWNKHQVALIWKFWCCSLQDRLCESW